MKTEIAIWQDYHNDVGLKIGQYKRDNGEIVELKQDKKSRFYYLNKDNEFVYLVWG